MTRGCFHCGGRSVEWLPDLRCNSSSEIRSLQEDARRSGAWRLSMAPFVWIKSPSGPCNWVLVISPIVLWTKQRLPIASSASDKALSSGWSACCARTRKRKKIFLKAEKRVPRCPRNRSAFGHTPRSTSYGKGRWVRAYFHTRPAITHCRQPNNQTPRNMQT